MAFGESGLVLSASGTLRAVAATRGIGSVRCAGGDQRQLGILLEVVSYKVFQNRPFHL